MKTDYIDLLQLHQVGSWDEVEDAVLPYLTHSRLDRWTHNKTIQKAIESYRVPDDRKTFLRTLRR